MEKTRSYHLTEEQNRNLETEYIEKQLDLQKQIDLANAVHPESVKTVAGVDLAYWKEDDGEHAVCCIVVIVFLTKEIIEKKYVSEKIKVPYIPGCLAFREIPLFLNAYEKVETDVDVLFFDGNGYLHPRHMGLATHAGIVIGKPTIGIAKSYFKIGDVDFTMPELEQNSFTDIIISGEVYGRVLRTHKAVKPIFVSIGNKIDLDTATQMASALVTKDSHIPIPTRLADIMTHEVRKAEKNSV
jgi:deoxyribonuclease V